MSKVDYKTSFVSHNKNVKLDVSYRHSEFDKILKTKRMQTISDKF